MHKACRFFLTLSAGNDADMPFPTPPRVDFSRFSAAAPDQFLFYHILILRNNRRTTIALVNNFPSGPLLAEDSWYCLNSISEMLVGTLPYFAIPHGNCAFPWVRDRRTVDNRTSPQAALRRPLGEAAVFRGLMMIPRRWLMDPAHYPELRSPSIANFHDRLQDMRPGLVVCLAEGADRGKLERHVGRIDRVRIAVVDGYFDADDREADHGPFASRL